MIDQPRSQVPSQPGPHRSATQPEKNSPTDKENRHSPRNSRVDVVAMVRSLQRTAGVADCFRKGNIDCGEIDCDWRVYCLDLPPETPKSPK